MSAYHHQPSLLPRPHNAAAWSLLEVLLALVILGLGMLICLHNVAHISTQFNQLRDHTLATIIAANIINTLRAQGAIMPIQHLSHHGTLTLQGRTWLWQWHTEPTIHAGLQYLVLTINTHNGALWSQQYAYYLYTMEPG